MILTFYNLCGIDFDVKTIVIRTLLAKAKSLILRPKPKLLRFSRKCSHEITGTGFVGCVY
jgi:hypothetical protein